MTEQVYSLTKNYRVKDKKFKEILSRVRLGEPTQKDADHIIKLHHNWYSADEKFKQKIENHKKTMWLFTKRQQVEEMNRREKALRDTVHHLEAAVAVRDEAKRNFKERARNADAKVVDVEWEKHCLIAQELLPLGKFLC